MKKSRSARFASQAANSSGEVDGVASTDLEHQRDPAHPEPLVGRPADDLAVPRPVPEPGPADQRRPGVHRVPPGPLEGQGAQGQQARLRQGALVPGHQVDADVGELALRLGDELVGRGQQVGGLRAGVEPADPVPGRGAPGRRGHPEVGRDPLHVRGHRRSSPRLGDALEHRAHEVPGTAHADDAATTQRIAHPRRPGLGPHDPDLIQPRGRTPARGLERPRRAPETWSKSGSWRATIAGQGWQTHHLPAHPRPGARTAPHRSRHALRHRHAAHRRVHPSPGRPVRPPQRPLAGRARDPGRPALRRGVPRPARRGRGRRPGDHRGRRGRLRARHPRGQGRRPVRLVHGRGRGRGPGAPAARGGPGRHPRRSPTSRGCSRRWPGCSCRARSAGSWRRTSTPTPRTRAATSSTSRSRAWACPTSRTTTRSRSRRSARPTSPTSRGCCSWPDGRPTSRTPQAAAERIMALETAIADRHWNNVDTRDALKSYNRRALAEVPGVHRGLRGPRVARGPERPDGAHRRGRRPPAQLRRVDRRAAGRAAAGRLARLAGVVGRAQRGVAAGRRDRAGQLRLLRHHPQRVAPAARALEAWRRAGRGLPGRGGRRAVRRQALPAGGQGADGRARGRTSWRPTGSASRSSSG